MKGMLSIISCVVIVFVFISSVAEAVEEYIVPVAGYFGSAPWVVSDVKGFFAEEGVKVRLKYYGAVKDRLNAFLHKRGHIGLWWNSTHVGFLVDKQNIVSVGVFAYETGNTRIIAKPEVTPANFITHKVGLIADVFPYRWFLWKYLNKHGIEMSDVKLAIVHNQDELLQNFLAGRLKVVLLIGGNADKAIQQGDGVIISAAEPQQTLFSVLMHKDVYQTTPKADLKKIYRALLKAIDWIQNPANEEELFAIFKKEFANNLVYTNIETAEGFQAVKAISTIIPPQELFTYNTTVLKESYETAQQVLADMGKPHTFTYSDIVDTSVLLEVLEEKELAGKPEATQ